MSWLAIVSHDKNSIAFKIYVNLFLDTLFLCHYNLLLIIDQYLINIVSSQLNVVQGFFCILTQTKNTWVVNSTTTINIHRKTI